MRVESFGEDRYGRTLAYLWTDDDTNHPSYKACVPKRKRDAVDDTPATTPPVEPRGGGAAGPGLALFFEWGGNGV